MDETAARFPQSIYPWHTMRVRAILITLLLLLPLISLCVSAGGAALADQPPLQASSDSANDSSPTTVPLSNRVCKVISVPLPVTLSGSQSLKQSLQQFAQQAPTATRKQDRAVVILEFQTGGRSTGAGSDSGACYSVARFLTSSQMASVQTIAYVKSNPDAQTPAKLEGHAVLIAIAADDLAMSKNTSIGNASAGDDDRDPFIEQAYQTVADQNLKKLPTEVVLSMINPDRGLFRVNTNRGIQYVSAVERDQLETSGDAIDSTTLAAGGKPAVLSAQTMAQYNLIKYSVANKSDLARQLNVPTAALSLDASGGQQWTALRVKMPEFLDKRSTRWLMRSIVPAAARHNANLLLLEFDDCSGDPDAATELGRFLSKIDTADVRTVAVVKNTARSGAALVALSCDQLLMQIDARLGGFGDAPAPDQPPVGSIHPDRQRSYQLDAQSIAAENETDWSILLAMIDAKTSVKKYLSNQSGHTRLLSDTEHAALIDKESWKQQGLINTQTGISANVARQNQLTALTFNADDEIKAYYQLTATPVPLTKTPTDRWVESLAAFLTAPGIPFFLLMAGFFCVSAEMSSPGLSLPGFLGTLCFAAFFWGQFFNGNAQWFEILLFAIGIVFLLTEVFVIPGFGVFGIGGIAMIGISIVLAAQSFVIPQNYRQLEQLPYSMFPLIGAGFGLIAAAVILPKLLPNTPFFKNIILSPPHRDELKFDGTGDHEAVADYSHLNGATGQTVTRLMPSGRAKFGDRIYDVITDGLVIQKGVTVKVTEAIANRIVVEQA